jgi:hypothetical protein
VPDAAKSRRRMQQPVRLLHPWDMSGIRHASPPNAINETQCQSEKAILPTSTEKQLSGRHRDQNGATR